MSLFNSNDGFKIKKLETSLADMTKYGVKSFGAIGDGNSHPLSSKYTTLTQAQVDFPFATSLSQEIDEVAIQKAINTAQANGYGTVELPSGKFLVGNISITQQLIKLKGKGCLSTYIIGRDASKNPITLIGTDSSFLYNVEVSGLSVQMSSGSNAGILTRCVAFSKFDDITIKGNSTSGSTQKIGGVQAGFVMEYSSYMNMFTNIKVTDCVGWGIQILDFSPDNHFYHCTTERNGAGGWYTAGNANLTDNGSQSIVRTIGQIILSGCISQNQPIAYYFNGYTGNVTLNACHSENISDCLLKIVGQGIDYGHGINNGFTITGCNLYASGADTTAMTTGLIYIDYTQNVYFSNNYMQRRAGTETLIYIGSNATNVIFGHNFGEFLTSSMILDNGVGTQFYNMNRFDIPSYTNYSVLTTAPNTNFNGAVSFSSGTAQSNGFGTLGAGLYRWRQANFAWVKIGGVMDFNNTTSNLTNGVNNTYGSVTTVGPIAGYNALGIKKIKVLWSGTFGGSETHTVKIQANYYDGTSNFVEKTATANGSIFLTDDDYTILIKNFTMIPSLSITAKSSLASSSVTAKVQVVGEVRD